MKQHKLLLISTICALGMTSCSDDFFNREPYNKDSSENFFDTENGVVLYLNGMLDKNIPSYATLTYGDQYSDNVAVNASSSFLKDGWSAEKQTGWSSGDWSGIYSANYMLSRLDEAAAAVNNKERMLHYEGVCRFWRAWLYYAKVRTFGDVPWYDSPIDSEDKEQLYKGRDPREYVMGKVLEDLNFATENCSIESQYVNNSNINRWIALAFKARVCLYEGTYMKYHTELGIENQSELAEKWLAEAVDACEILMSESPYSLVHSPANVTNQYRKLFTQEAVNYQEVIFANEYNAAQLRLHPVTWKYTSGSYGNRWSLSKAFVNTYLNLDGSRVTDKAGYNKTEYTNEFTGRDYRLQQSIVSPAYTKKISGTSTLTPPNFSITLTGYQVIKWSLDDDTFEGMLNSYNSLPIFRFAEVLLNYAEAKAELGEFTAVEWDATIRPLRQRAGVNGDAPAVADPYLVDYYMNQTTDKWILEIRRERAIEMLLENLRYDDLMRWKLGDMLEAKWAGIYIPSLGTPMDLNGDGVNDLCVNASGGGSDSNVFYIDLSKMTQYSLDDDNCLVYSEERIWDDSKYLHPIPQSALNVNPALGQNEGWDK